MGKKTVVSGALAVIIAMGLFLQPVQAYSWPGARGAHRDKGRHYPRHGNTVFSLPGTSLSINLGGLSFFYSDGVFYRRSGARFTVVKPPRGALIKTLPWGYQKVVINGITYYTNDGIYYQAVPRGYMVVDEPQTVYTYTVPMQAEGDTFILNIPNYRGGYTPVVIRRSGSGFVGPQGEYYAGFPSMEQLRIMYANR